ncbi:hypothetical protein DPSP01_006076 [Paraphaeosphaeria sporulosa]
MEESIDGQIEEFVHLLNEICLSTDEKCRPKDFAEKKSFLTLDVMSKLAFGEAFGYLDQDRDVYDYLNTTATFILIIMAL